MASEGGSEEGVPRVTWRLEGGMVLTDTIKGGCVADTQGSRLDVDMGVREAMY